jgi:hypothetical protein
MKIWLLPVLAIMGGILLSTHQGHAEISCENLIGTSLSAPSQINPANTTAGRFRISAPPGIGSIASRVVGHLVGLIFPNGINHHIDGQTLTARSLQTENPELIEMLKKNAFGPILEIFNSKQVKSTLAQFAPEFGFENGSFRLEISEIRLTDTRADQLSVGDRGRFDHGAMIEVEIKVSSLGASLNNARFSVTNNSSSEIRAKQIGFNARSEISLVMPLFLAVDSTGRPNFQILNVKGLAPNEFAFNVKDLSLPDVKIKIGNAPLLGLIPKTTITAEIPEALLTGLSHPEFVDHMSSQLVSFFNNTLANLIESRFTQERGIEFFLTPNQSVLGPRGGAPGRPQTHLKVNLWPVSMNSKEATIAVNVEKTSENSHRSGQQKYQEIGPCPISCTSHAVALAINKPLIDQLLGRIHELGLLEKISIPQGTISIKEVPQVLTYKANGIDERSATLSLRLNVTPLSIQGLPENFTGGKSSVAVEVQLKATPDENGRKVKIQIISLKVIELNLSNKGGNASAIPTPAQKPNFLRALTIVAANKLAETAEAGAKAAFNKFIGGAVGKFANHQIQVPLPEALTALLGPLRISGFGFDQSGAFHILLAEIPSGRP